MVGNASCYRRGRMPPEISGRGRRCCSPTELRARRGYPRGAS